MSSQYQQQEHPAGDRENAAVACCNLLERITRRYDPAFSEELRSRKLSDSARKRMEASGLISYQPSEEPSPQKKYRYTATLDGKYKPLLSEVTVATEEAIALLKAGEFRRGTLRRIAFKHRIPYSSLRGRFNAVVVSRNMTYPTQGKVSE